MNQDELYHYGILGMRWGKRKARVSSADSVNVKNLRKKKINELSNQELKTANERLRLEKEYKGLTQKTNIGKKAIRSYIGAAGLITAAVAATQTYKKYGGSVLNKLSNLVVPNITIGK